MSSKLDPNDNVHFICYAGILALLVGLLVSNQHENIKDRKQSHAE